MRVLRLSTGTTEVVANFEQTIKNHFIYHWYWSAGPIYELSWEVLGIGIGHIGHLQGIKLSQRTTFCSEPICSTLHCIAICGPPKKIGSFCLCVSSTASTNHGPTNSLYIISGTHFIQKFKAYGRSFHASCVAAFLVCCCDQVWRRRETQICPCFTFSSSEEKPMWHLTGKTDLFHWH